MTDKQPKPKPQPKPLRPIDVIGRVYDDNFHPPADACPFNVYRRYNGKCVLIPHEFAAILYYAVVAGLSGKLDDVKELLDITDAIAHGKAMHEAGILSDEQIMDGINELGDECERDAQKAGTVRIPGVAIDCERRYTDPR
jgi:hypothetical protein